MDTAGFFRWALDDARTREERFTTELLVEEGVRFWFARHQPGKGEPWEVTSERDRQRALNPAYEPSYSKASLERAVERLAEIKEWSPCSSLHHYPIRDLKVLRWLPMLETVKAGSEADDLSPLADLPRLRVLHLGYPKCGDLRPLARCRELRELSVSLGSRWPEVAGLEELQQLESFSLGGNLFALPAGLVWPRVVRGELHCSPLAMRTMRDFPCFPACRFLKLSGVDRLEGIERFPRLLNLTLTGPVRDFAPLAALPELTCLNFNGAEPFDVTPLNRVPRLHFVSFAGEQSYGLAKQPPRDYAPLGEAPMLREVIVTGCAPVEAEVGTLNALLTPWDDLFLAQTPRPLPPLRMVVVPYLKLPRFPESSREPDEPEPVDEGLRECEGRWAERFLTKLITARIGNPDWGTAGASGASRTLSVVIECFEVVERLPEILEVMREAMSRLRGYHGGYFRISLKVPPLEWTAAQKQLQKQFDDEQQEADYQRRRREEQEYLDRLHRYQLLKEGGAQVKPEQFAAPTPTPPPPAPWEREDEDEDEDDASFGDLAVKKKPDPPPSWFDNEHPLAEEYYLWGALTLSEAWFSSHSRDLAIYLMRRQPDLEIPEEPKQVA